MRLELTDTNVKRTFLVCVSICTSYFGSMNQYDQTFYLKINVGHCDLYSMVQ